MDLKDEIKMMGGTMSEEELAAIESEQTPVDEVSAEATTEEHVAETPVDETLVNEEKELTAEERYANLLNLYNEQSGQLLEMQSRTTSPPVAPPPPAAVPTVPVALVADFQLDEETLTRALLEDDAPAMKQVLMGVISYVKQLADPQKLREQLLLDMPAVARNIADQRFTMMMAVREFYDNNSDLKPYMPIVGSVVNEVASKNPQMSLADVLAETEKETRKRLGIRKHLNAADTATNRGKPAFAGSGGSRKPGAAPQTSGLKKDIQDMMAVR